MTYEVVLVCQGELMQKLMFEDLAPALSYFLDLLNRYGKFGTMMVKLKAC